MSGFLQRLAAQAMGSANTPRSAMRQPYSATHSPIYTEVSDRPTAALDSTDDELQTAARSGAEAIPVTAQSKPRSSINVNIGAQPQEDSVVPSQPEVLISPVELTAKPDRSNTRLSSAKTMSGLPDANPEKAVANELPLMPDGIEIHIPEDNSTIGTFFHDKQNPIHPDSDVSPLLLPLSNSARPSASSARAVAKRRVPRDSALQAHIEETTEVHVSIGRIEVTAVHEAPPPKRQAPTSAKPMSLDEYLARRTREA